MNTTGMTNLVKLNVGLVRGIKCNVVRAYNFLGFF